jgi:hypothetical protein
VGGGAARLLDAAKTATDPDRRAAFIHLAATYHELAIKAATDVDAPPTASSGRQGADFRSNSRFSRTTERIDPLRPSRRCRRLKTKIAGALAAQCLTGTNPETDSTGRLCVFRQKWNESKPNCSRPDCQVARGRPFHSRRLPVGRLASSRRRRSGCERNPEVSEGLVMAGGSDENSPDQVGRG